MKKFSFSALLFVSATLFIFVDRPMAQDLAEGQKVFDNICSSCHSILCHNVIARE